jgi:hypothetical protein
MSEKSRITPPVSKNVFQLSNDIKRILKAAHPVYWKGWVYSPDLPEYSKALKFVIYQLP